MMRLNGVRENIGGGELRYPHILLMQVFVL
jgi:hypothetical protein